MRNNSHFTIKITLESLYFVLLNFTWRLHIEVFRFFLMRNNRLYSYIIIYIENVCRLCFSSKRRRAYPGKIFIYYATMPSVRSLVHIIVNSRTTSAFTVFFSLITSPSSLPLPSSHSREHLSRGRVYIVSGITMSLIGFDSASRFVPRRGSAIYRKCRFVYLHNNNNNNNVTRVFSGSF